MHAYTQYMMCMFVNILIMMLKALCLTTLWHAGDNIHEKSIIQRWINTHRHCTCNKWISLQIAEVACTWLTFDNGSDPPGYTIKPRHHHTISCDLHIHTMYIQCTCTCTCMYTKEGEDYYTCSCYGDVNCTCVCMGKLERNQYMHDKLHMIVQA